MGEVSLKNLNQLPEKEKELLSKTREKKDERIYYFSEIFVAHKTPKPFS